MSQSCSIVCLKGAYEVSSLHCSKSGGRGFVYINFSHPLQKVELTSKWQQGFPQGEVPREVCEWVSKSGVEHSFCPVFFGLIVLTCSPCPLVFASSWSFMPSLALCGCGWIYVPWPLSCALVLVLLDFLFWSVSIEFLHASFPCLDPGPFQGLQSTSTCTQFYGTFLNHTYLPGLAASFAPLLPIDFQSCFSNLP